MSKLMQVSNAANMLPCAARPVPARREIAAIGTAPDGAWNVVPRNSEISPPSIENAWAPWEPVDFNEANGAASAAKRPPQTRTDRAHPDAAALVENMRQGGYQAGFEAGRIDGLKAGHAAAEAELRQTAAQLAQAVSRLDSGVADMEQAVAEELLALAIEIARKVIIQSVIVKPRGILETIHQALAQMPAQHTVIRLNAEDAALVRSLAGEQLGRAGHRIHEDSHLARGDAVVEAGGAQLDCRLATRWRRIIGTLDQDTPWLVADEAESA